MYILIDILSSTAQVRVAVTIDEYRFLPEHIKSLYKYI
jgi:hypothetical protein